MTRMLAVPPRDWKGSKNILMDGSGGRSDDYTLRKWHSINAGRPGKQPCRSGHDDDDDNDSGVHPGVISPSGAIR
jgi:hypothetical protein